jgi:hypothetical protein
MNVRIQRLFIVGLSLLSTGGCKKQQEEARLLVAYSGDCQAYLEPCG